MLFYSRSLSNYLFPGISVFLFSKFVPYPRIHAQTGRDREREGRKRKMPIPSPESVIVIIVPLLQGPADSTSPLVKVLAILISYLAAALTPTILPALLESRIQIRPNDSFVKLRAPNVLHAIQRILMRVILYEAEPTGCLLKPIEAHD